MLPFPLRCNYHLIISNLPVCHYLQVYNTQYNLKHFILSHSKCWPKYELCGYNVLSKIICPHKFFSLAKSQIMFNLRFSGSMYTKFVVVFEKTNVKKVAFSSFTSQTITSKNINDQKQAILKVFIVSSSKLNACLHL